MWYPNQQPTQEIIQLFLSVLQTDQVKAELAKQTRTEIDNQSRKNLKSNMYTGPQSYESLTSGDVNMQTRMAQSGYDVYGRTIISGNRDFRNNNAFKNMKNKIRYGKAPQNPIRNRGKYTIT